MQLLLWCTLIDWLDIFYMVHIIYRRGVILLNRYRDLLSIPGMKPRISYTIQKGEKQIQILDGY
jgi:hypothetical protein